MNTYGGVDIEIHVLLTSALVGGGASCPGCFTPGERALGTHWIRGWVGPETGLDDVEKIQLLTIPALDLRPLGSRTRSHLLYRLRYPGSLLFLVLRYSSSEVYILVARRHCFVLYGEMIANPTQCSHTAVGLFLCVCGLFHDTRSSTRKVCGR
jgi:hypothetical protein